MHISRTKRGRPPGPRGRVAMAMGMHSTMMAWEPLTMLPKKKMRANTRKVGIGREEKKPGRAAMTPVAASTSLKTMMRRVETISLASKAEAKKGFSSAHLNFPTRALRTMQMRTER